MTGVPGSQLAFQCPRCSARNAVTLLAPVQGEANPSTNAQLSNASKPPPIVPTPEGGARLLSRCKTITNLLVVGLVILIVLILSLPNVGSRVWDTELEPASESALPRLL